MTHCDQPLTWFPGRFNMESSSASISGYTRSAQRWAPQMWMSALAAIHPGKLTPRILQMVCTISRRFRRCCRFCSTSFPSTIATVVRSIAPRKIPVIDCSILGISRVNARTGAADPIFQKVDTSWARVASPYSRGDRRAIPRLYAIVLSRSHSFADVGVTSCSNSESWRRRSRRSLLGSRRKAPRTSAWARRRINGSLVPLNTHWKISTYFGMERSPCAPSKSGPSPVDLKSSGVDRLAWLRIACAISSAGALGSSLRFTYLPPPQTAFAAPLSLRVVCLRGENEMV